MLTMMAQGDLTDIDNAPFALGTGNPSILPL